MQERSRSIVMPGAHHVDDSAYVSIYFKDEYNFCILAEKPIPNYYIKSFEYYEYNVEQRHPGLLGHISGSDLHEYYLLPKQKISSQEFLAKRKELNIGGYKEVFSGEIEVDFIHQHLDKRFELEGKYCTYSSLRYLFKSKSMIILNSKTNHSFSACFASGLKQLESSVDIMGMDLSTHDRSGKLGKGCLLAIAQALQSGSCIHHKNLTINICGYSIKPDEELVLKQALESPLCPLGVKFNLTRTVNRLVNTDLLQVDPQTKILINLVRLFQFFKQNNYPIDPIKIIFYFICPLKINTNHNEIYKNNSQFCLVLFNRRTNIDKINLKLEKLQIDLCKKISDQVCTFLNFDFNVGKESWKMISPTLFKSIQSEVQDVLKIILQNLTPTQSTILFRNRVDIEQFALQAAGSIQFGQSFNVVTGYDIQTSGLTGMYFSDLVTQKTELAGSLFRHTMNMESKPGVQFASVNLSHDSTDNDKEIRQDQIIFTFYKAVANQATPEQLDVLIEDSKNKKSKMVKLLNGNRAIQGSYHDYLIKLKQTKEIRTGSLMVPNKGGSR